jgi:hypothetical protein
MQADREFTDRVTAVRQECDRLVFRQSLVFEQFQETALGLGIVTAHKTKTLRGSTVCGHTFTHDHLKPPFGSGALTLRVDVSAIQADDPRGSWLG